MMTYIFAHGWWMGTTLALFGVGMALYGRKHPQKPPVTKLDL
jgi:hypothetical protein